MITVREFIRSPAFGLSTEVDSAAEKTPATMSWLLMPLLSIPLAMQPAAAADYSGTLKSQTSFSTSGDSDIQQQEWLLDLEMNERLGQGELTAIARIRLDTVDDLNPTGSVPAGSYSSLGGPLLSGKNGQFGLREFYWQYGDDAADWKIGKQQVVWGEADGLKLLDVINPQNFREFILDDFDDSRIPLWMINA